MTDTADLAHAAEDVRRHLALRARAGAAGALDNPDVIAAVWHDGESHALTETVLRTLLAERDALTGRVELLENFPAFVIGRDVEHPLDEIEKWKATYAEAVRGSSTPAAAPACICSCPVPGTDLCACPTPCHCSPDCATCDAGQDALAAPSEAR